MTQNIFIILLGCNIQSILMDRLNASFNFIDLLNQNHKSNNDSFEIKITWFLSGGIKFSYPNAKTEASLMQTQVENFMSSKIPINSNIDWDFVLDELSTNTAENFVRASNFLNQTKTYDSVYIVTSNYHTERAKLMMNLIDQSRQYQ